MDEPTSSLTLTETNRLLEVIAELKADGVSIIFITHRLNEIEQCADRVVALRDGAVVGTLQRAEIEHDRMIRLMIGRDLKTLYTPPKVRAVATEILAVDGRCERRPIPDRPVNFSLRRGEIRRPRRTGRRRPDRTRARHLRHRPAGSAASITVDGRAVAIQSPRDAIDHGIYLDPGRPQASRADPGRRHHQQYLAPEPLALRRRRPARSRSRARQRATQQAARLNIRAPSVASVAGTLSGGNQQKVVLAKWLAMSPNVMLFDEPTRGIDVGAKSEIYSLMRALADAGVAVLMISSDMEEVIGVSDRILVMHEGRISGVLERDQFSEHNVMQLAVGKTTCNPETAMLKKDLGLLLLILVVGAVVALINPRFLSPINLANTANLIGLFGLFSLGEGLVIITGGIDLSIGSVFALLGVIFVDLLVTYELPWPLAALIVMVAGTCIGVIHGFLITRMRLQPFVVTLCGLLLYRGIARYYTNDGTAGFDFGQSFPTLEWLTTGRSFGVPHSFIAFVLVALVMAVVLHRSVFGRYLFAVGKNEEAARYSGIRTGRVVAAAYVICGALAGLSSIFLTMYTRSISPASHGNFYELYGIAAAVLGGCSLRGGEGSIVGIVLGAILLQILQNLVNLLGIPSSLNFAVMGAVILIGVLADQQLKAYRERKTAGRDGGQRWNWFSGAGEGNPERPATFSNDASYCRNFRDFYCWSKYAKYFFTALF